MMKEGSAAEELSTPLLSTADGGGDPVKPALGKSALSNSSSNQADVLASDLNYESHFTLRTPTSTVKFRGSTLRIIDTDHDQIILQGGDGDDDQGGNKVYVKRLSVRSYAQRALRLGYTLITLLFVGFMFVFCFQVLLFLFIDLPVSGGVVTGDGGIKTIQFISTILSIPLMLYGMSNMMTMGSAFVSDTYKGAAIFNSTAVEIVYMLVFLVVPILTFAFSLMTRSQHAWRTTGCVWMGMVLLLFVVWALAVTVKQVSFCFWLVEKHFMGGGGDGTVADQILDEMEASDEGAETADSTQDQNAGAYTEGQDALVWKKLKRLARIAKRAMLLTQTARYAGMTKERFEVSGGDASSSRLSHFGLPTESSTAIYSQLTTLSVFSKLFKKLDAPKRVYRFEEIKGTVPFITKWNFSMEKMWCAGDIRQRNVIVASGPSALTPNQIKLSALCTTTASVAVTLFVLGGLVWMNLGSFVYILAMVFAILCCIWPMFRKSFESVRMYQGINFSLDLDEGEGGSSFDDSEDANLLQVWMTRRITEPKEWYCYARILFEVAFLFFWPFVSMLVTHNYPIAFVFFFVGMFSFLWQYFDSAVVLSEVVSEVGSIPKVTGHDFSHQEEYRLNEVISKVISPSGRRLWYWIYSVFLCVLLVMIIAANGSTTTVKLDQETTSEETKEAFSSAPNTRPPILMIDDFYYPGVDDTLAYPTCKLTKGFTLPGEEATNLGDFAFLTAMAYETPRVTKFVLDQYFGEPDVLVDEDEFVARYKSDTGLNIPVSFKLFSMPAYPGFAVMSIRGSETIYDWLGNFQLWSAAALAQGVKWIIPFGWIFDPILPDLILFTSAVESSSISKVSYYKGTTQFVSDVLSGYGENMGKSFSEIKVTGVSLGGGLALITGAQTEAYTIAFSAPGATLSRLTYDPPVDVEKLNAHTFNFIPERDYIAALGGRAPLYQNGQCIAPKSDLFGCHSMWRSICEISYRCGSNSRAVPCRCVDLFGYPEPVQNGTRSFEQACKEANATWYEEFPPEL